MKKAIAAVLVALSVSAPAHANWLFGADPSCEASDLACLKDLALTSILTDIKENDPRNHSGPGRRYAKLESRLTVEEAQAARAKIEAVAPSEDFWSLYNRDTNEAQARKSMNYEGILSAVEGRGYPDQMKWRVFISDAIFLTANGSDADKLGDLFLREPEFFAKYAEQESVPIIAYMARSNLDALKDFAADPDMPKRTLLSSLTPLALEAELACRDGDTALGKDIMAFRNSYAETQIYTPELSFLPLVNSFPFVLACEGEEQAIAELAEIEAGLESVPTGQSITYRGLKMSIDGMRIRYVMDYVVLPLSYHYNDTGRVDDAKALFEKYKAASVELAYDEAGKPVYVAQAEDHPMFADYSEAKKVELGIRITDLMDYAWEEALERRAEGDRYSSDLATRLDYFINRFDPPFKICCSDGQGVETMIEDLVTASASDPVPPEGLTRALDLIARAEKSGKRTGISSDAVSALRLSMAEKPNGCALSDDRLNELIVEVEEIEDIASRTIGLLEVIAYQQTPLGDRTDAPCILK